MAEFRAGQILRADALNALAEITTTSEATAQPAFNPSGSWTDFPSGDFPPITASIPAGGGLRITVSARLLNSSGTNSSCYLGWRTEGANTIADQFKYAVGSGGPSLVKASTEFTFRDLAAGDTTVIPQWYISSGGPTTAELNQAWMQVAVLL